MVKQIKKELRAEICLRRDLAALPLRQSLSHKVMQWVISSREYQQAEWLFCFLSMGSEVDTTPIVKNAFADGKKVAVPVAKKNRFMYFLEITSLQGLNKNKMGILEPKGDVKREVTPKKTDLFLTPGVAFDRDFGRLGYGGGYYDTFFQNHTGIEKIGLAFAMQMLDVPLPMEEYDYRVDSIITENGWIRRRVV